MTVNFQTSKSIYNKDNTLPLNNSKKSETLLDTQTNRLHTETTTSETLQLAVDTKKKSISPNTFSFKIASKVSNTGELKTPSGYKLLTSVLEDVMKKVKQ